MADFIKKVSFEKSVKNNSEYNNYNSNDVEILDLFDDEVPTDQNNDSILNGKYVDKNGRSFDAEYYYSPDGVYNTRYKDGNKNINIRFNVDGSEMSSDITYD